MTKLRKGFLCGAILLFAASLCLLFFTWGAQHGREREGDYWRMRAEHADASIAALQAENDALKAAAAELPAPSAEDPAQQALLDDLLKQTALIPIESSLGGTMRFFPALTKVLNERYIYAYAEDGHVAVDMIFLYQQTEGAGINWRLAQYDTGNGWQAA